MKRKSLFLCSTLCLRRDRIRNDGSTGFPSRIPGHPFSPQLMAADGP